MKDFAVRRLSRTDDMVLGEGRSRIGIVVNKRGMRRMMEIVTEEKEEARTSRATLNEWSMGGEAPGYVLRVMAHRVGSSAR